MVVALGFGTTGVEVLLRRLFWLRVGVALARCVSKGSAMAIGRCTASHGCYKGDKILFMRADRSSPKAPALAPTLEAPTLSPSPSPNTLSPSPSPTPTLAPTL